MISVSVIGAGYMAREHIRAFQNVPGVRVKGIYSRTHERAAKLAVEYNIEEVCDSVESLFNKTRSDIVVIAVSELSVRHVCEEVFKFPWISLIEKPPGYDVIDAEKILSVAEGYKSKAFVALNRRHYCSTAAVLNDLKNNDEQRIIHIFDQQDQNQIRQLHKPELVIKNLMYANSIHLIDYFKLFGRGEITEVHPIITWDAEKPNFVLAQIYFSSGDIGTYHAIWNGPGPWSVTVTTKIKRWELRPLEQAAFQLYGSRKQEIIEIDQIDVQYKPGIFKQAEETIKVLTGQPHSLPTLKETIESMYLVKAIYGEGFNSV